MQLKFQKCWQKNLLIFELLIVVMFIYLSKTFLTLWPLTIIIFWTAFLCWRWNKTKAIIIFNIIFLIFFIFLHWNFNVNPILNHKKFVVQVVKEHYAILAHGTLKIYVSSYDINFHVGEYYQISGTMQHINKSAASWEFDFAKYLDDQNIIWQIDSKVADITKLNGHSFRYGFYEWICHKTPFEQSVFGQLKTGQAYQNLIEMSLSFLFNWSYLTFGMINLFLAKIIKNKRTMMMVQIGIIQVLMPFIIFLNFPAVLVKYYLAILISSISFLRHWRWKRSSKWCTIWLIELLINPWYIFNIGFIYISLCFLFLKWNDDHRWWIKTIRNFFLINILFLPIQAFYDYKIFWTSSFFQILLSPIISLSILFLLPSLPFKSSHYQSFFDHTMTSVTHFFLKISLTTIVGALPLLLLITYYLFLKLFLLYHRKISQWLCGGMLVICSLFFVFYNDWSQKDNITMLNVGDGNSFIARMHGKYFLFDAGSGYGLAKTKVRDYLVYYGVRTIERVFLSHQHDDHVNQLDAVKKVIKVKATTSGWNRFQHIVNDTKIAFTSFVTLGHKDENANSMVTTFNYQGRQILFTGDATNEVLEQLEQNGEFVEAVKNGVDFYQVPHHGSDTSNIISFTKLINPRVLFISCRYGKNRPFPKPSTMQNFAKLGLTKIYITGVGKTWRYYFNNSVTTI